VKSPSRATLRRFFSAQLITSRLKAKRRHTVCLSHAYTGCRHLSEYSSRSHSSFSSVSEAPVRHTFGTSVYRRRLFGRVGLRSAQRGDLAAHIYKSADAQIFSHYESAFITGPLVVRRTAIELDRHACSFDIAAPAIWNSPHYHLRSPSIYKGQFRYCLNNLPLPASL